MNPVALVFAATLSFMLGMLQSSAWFIPAAAFALAYVVHVARWIFR